MGLSKKGKHFMKETRSEKSASRKKEKLLKKEQAKKEKLLKKEPSKKVRVEPPKKEPPIKVDATESKKGNEKLKSKEIKNNMRTQMGKYAKQIKCAITVVLAIACAALTATFSSKVQEGTIRNKLDYSDKNKIGYHIDLKENPFYEEDTQKSNMSYISSLIDNVDLNFNYNLHFDDKVDYSYHYAVNAKLYITDKNAKDSGDKVLFEDTEQLLESETKTGNAADVKISESLSIPYEKYNSIVQSFASANGIAPTCYLDIKFSVNATGKFEDIDNINRSSETSLRIPLNEKLIDIDETAATKEDSGQFVSKGINVLWLIFAIVFGVLFALLLFRSIKSIKACLPNLKPYEKEIKDIFKKYDQLIVKSKRMFKVNENLTEVYAFEDLVNVSDRIQQPIKFYEIKSGEEAIFIIDNLQYEAYVFLVKLDDEELL